LCVVSAFALLSSLVLSVGSATAQESKSALLAEELSQQMIGGQLDAVAAKDTVDDDRYVAALAFPGQLLVVSARYEVPVYLEEKLGNGEFREVYIDLNTASIGGTKVLITDIGANGLLANDASGDTYDAGAGILRFDGSASGSSIAEADEQYARMLRVLIESVP
jgi:hypothetical protein